MKKFPVSSKGVDYCAEIVTFGFHYGKGVLLYLNDEKVYTFRDTFLKYQNDYIELVKEAVHGYEEYKNAQDEKSQIENENIRKFEEWDGDCQC